MFRLLMLKAIRKLILQNVMVVESVLLSVRQRQFELMQFEDDQILSKLEQLFEKVEG